MRDKAGASRGFGFVIYKTPEDAKRVSLESYELDGRKLDIKQAVTRETMAQQINRPHSNKVYVAGIAWDCSEEDLADYFKKFGSVAGTMIQKDKFTGRSRGFGFVIFDDAEAVENCLARADQLEIKGRRLEVKRALAKGSAVLLYPDSGGRSNKIYVAGVDAECATEDLHDYFSQYGAIEECYIQKDRSTGASRGFAFITFVDFAGAESALKKLTHEIPGKGSVDVKIARPKPERPPAPQYGAPPRAAVPAGPPSWGRPPYAQSPYTPYGGATYPPPYPHYAPPPSAYTPYAAPPAPASHYGATPAPVATPAPGSYPGAQASSPYDSRWAAAYASDAAASAASASYGAWSQRDTGVTQPDASTSYGSHQAAPQQWGMTATDTTKAWAPTAGYDSANVYAGYAPAARRDQARTRAYHPYGRS